jgi:DNA-binding CsgD family transcriptional regulator
VRTVLVLALWFGKEIIMAQLPRLSNREWDVLKLLLQGKSNKQIASSLDISVRTVEFHLKNIYAKFQVRTRIELILTLGNATGGFEIEKLVRATVDEVQKEAENGVTLNSRMSWLSSFRAAISMVGRELKMKLFKRNQGDFMKPSFTNVLIALGLIIIGVALAAAGIYVGETDDAPGAALLGILLMIGTVVLSVRTVWRRA